MNTARKRPPKSGGQHPKPADLGTSTTERGTRIIEAYWDGASYWTQNDKGYFTPVNKGQLDGLLAEAFYSESEAKRFFNETIRKRSVSYVGPLAGYLTEGLHDNGKMLIMVTQEPTIIEATHGRNTMLKDYFDRLLGKEQATYWHLWLKFAREAFLAGNMDEGQAMAITGPRDTGKSLGCVLGSLCIGGRYADPEQYFRGQTQFNKHLYEAEVLFMDDPGGGAEYSVRRLVGDKIRQIVAGKNPQLHAKGRTPISIKVFWRIMVTVNDEAEDLQILPPLTEGMQDKLIILKAIARAVDHPTHTIQLKKAYYEKLVASVGDYLGWLERLQVPSGFSRDRFNIKAYQHPDVVEALQDFSPELKLLRLIDEEWVGRESVRKVTAAQVERELKEDMGTNNYAANEAKRLLKNPGACGKYLARLARVHPERVKKAGRETVRDKSGKTASGSVLYEITAPPSVVATPVAVTKNSPR